MKKTIVMSKLIRANYEFTEEEIRDALMKAYNIPLFDSKRKRIEFYISVIDTPKQLDKATAYLTLVYQDEEIPIKEKEDYPKDRPFDLTVVETIE